MSSAHVSRSTIKFDGRIVVAALTSARRGRIFCCRKILPEMLTVPYDEDLPECATQSVEYWRILAGHGRPPHIPRTMIMGSDERLASDQEYSVVLDLEYTWKITLVRPCRGARDAVFQTEMVYNTWWPAERSCLK